MSEECININWPAKLCEMAVKIPSNGEAFISAVEPAAAGARSMLPVLVRQDVGGGCTAAPTCRKAATTGGPGLGKLAA